MRQLPHRGIRSKGERSLAHTRTHAHTHSLGKHARGGARKGRHYHKTFTPKSGKTRARMTGNTPPVATKAILTRYRGQNAQKETRKRGWWNKINKGMGNVGRFYIGCCVPSASSKACDGTHSASKFLTAVTNKKKWETRHIADVHLTTTR